MTGTTDILSLIDAAVTDWETGPDAVRYNAPSPPVPAPRTSGSPFNSANARLFIGDREIPVTDVSTDARWPTWPASASMFRAAAEFERGMLELQHGMTGLMSVLDPSPLDLLAQYLREIQQHWICFVCGTTWYGTWDHECRPPQYDAHAEHQMRVQLLKAFRVRPHEIGIRDMGCFCHSAPFPASRDYRRRTKHRRRR